MNLSYKNKYNQILAKRFPGSKSEETTAHQTPIRLLKNNQDKKYNFYIPAHLKSRSKEYFGNKNNPKQWKINKLSVGKNSFSLGQNSRKYTKRKLLNSLKEKFITPKQRFMKFNKPSNRSRYSNESSVHNRSESLPNIMNKSVSQSSDYNSQSTITKPRNLSQKHFQLNKELNFNKNNDENPYGRSNY